MQKCERLIVHLMSVDLAELTAKSTVRSLVRNSVRLEELLRSKLKSGIKSELWHLNPNPILGLWRPQSCTCPLCPTGSGCYVSPTISTLMALVLFCGI